MTVFDLLRSECISMRPGCVPVERTAIFIMTAIGRTWPILSARSDARRKSSSLGSEGVLDLRLGNTIVRELVAMLTMLARRIGRKPCQHRLLSPLR